MQHEDVTQPHIIAMTTNTMDDYVSKPIRVNELVDALLKCHPVSNK